MAKIIIRAVKASLSLKPKRFLLAVENVLMVIPSLWHSNLLPKERCGRG
jgi:hypothetical protein